MGPVCWSDWDKAPHKAARPLLCGYDDRWKEPWRLHDQSHSLEPVAAVLVGCNSAESVTAGGGAPVVGDAPAPVPSAAPLPAGNSVIVEGGAESTRDLFVSLTLASVGATEMAVYPNADCSGPVAWRPYGATLPWVLHQANNDVFVSAKFRNEALAESPCVFDSIRHDDQAAAAPGITSPHNGATVEERSLSYSGSCATEAGAVTTASPGPGAAVSALSCAAGVLSATVSFTPVSGEVARTVTFQTADAAGNAASLVHAVYLKEPVGFAENVMGGGVNNAVNALALQPDGKIIAAGAFTTKRLARFLADGTPDVDFSAPSAPVPTAKSSPRGAHGWQNLDRRRLHSIQRSDRASPGEAQRLRRLGHGLHHRR